MAKSVWKSAFFLSGLRFAALSFGAWIVFVSFANPHRRVALTYDEALQRSEELCRTILSQRVQLRLYAEPIERLNEDKSDDRDWKVICADPAGNDVLHLYWSAESGQLRLIECPGRIRAHSPADILSPERARRQAQYWVRALKILKDDQHCHIVDSELMPNVTWWFRFQSGDGFADISIEPQSGELIQAKTRSYNDSSNSPAFTVVGRKALQPN